MVQEEEKRIVIVEPNVKVRGPLFKYLKTLYGYTVKVAKSGSEGIQKVRQYKPHLVMISKDLPDMSWKSTAEKMKKKYTSLCIIVTGEDLSADDKKYITEHRGYSWFEQPYPMNELVPKIELMFKVWLRSYGARPVTTVEEEPEEEKTARRVLTVKKGTVKGRKIRIRAKDASEDIEEAEVVPEPMRD